MCLRGYGPSCTEDIEWLPLHRRPGGKGANQLIALADLIFPHISTGHFIPTYVIAKGRRCCRRDMCSQFLYAFSSQKVSSTRYNKPYSNSSTCTRLYTCSQCHGGSCAGGVTLVFIGWQGNTLTISGWWVWHEGNREMGCVL